MPALGVGGGGSSPLFLRGKLAGLYTGWCMWGWIVFVSRRIDASFVGGFLEDSKLFVDLSLVGVFEVN